MMDRSQDDAGVLGNLPRTRPGRRSEKRASGATTTAAPPPPEPEAAEAPERSSDPLGEIVRGGLRVAGNGVRVADTVARELLRRLPRP